MSVGADLDGTGLSRGAVSRVDSAGGARVSVCADGVRCFDKASDFS